MFDFETFKSGIQVQKSISFGVTPHSPELKATFIVHTRKLGWGLITKFPKYFSSLSRIFLFCRQKNPPVQKEEKICSLALAQNKSVFIHPIFCNDCCVKSPFFLRVWRQQQMVGNYIRDTVTTRDNIPRQQTFPACIGMWISSLMTLR